MTLELLRRHLVAFARKRKWTDIHTPRNLAEALAVEAGELLELFLWGADPDPQRIGEEVADVIIYAVQVADAAGVDLPVAIRRKLESNRKKYPEIDDA
jgi:NTP pyrophosphatase (non-canonical NTP hydrolase)